MKLIIFLFLYCHLLASSSLPDRCAICFEALQEDQTIETPLKFTCTKDHTSEFHQNCLLTAFNHGRRSCLLCNSPITTTACLLCNKYIEDKQSAQTLKDSYQFRGQCPHLETYHACCLAEYIEQKSEEYKEAYCKDCGKKITKAPYTALPTMRRMFKQHIKLPLHAALVLAIDCSALSLGYDEIQARINLTISSALTGVAFYLFQKQD